MRFFSVALRRHGERRAIGDDGFTLVEVLVAMMIFVVSLLALAHVATAAFTDVAFARQRQAATGLGNETLEKMRALAIDAFKKGLRESDLSTDPNVTGAPGSYLFEGEPVVADGTSDVDPLVPNTREVTIGATTYKLSVYVTQPTPDVYLGTAVITWNSIRGSGGRLQTQSEFYFPQGCQSNSTHPFAAPCEPAFFSGASTGAGNIRITGVPDIANFQDATLWLPEQRSDLQTEQVFSVQGTSRLPSAVIRYTDGTEESPAIGITGPIISASSTNPTESKPAYEDNADSQAGGELFKDDVVSQFRLRASGASGRSISTVAANASNPCLDHSNAGQIDDLPCGRVTGEQTGESYAELTTPLRGTARLASVNNSSAPNIAYSNRDVAPSAGMCPSTTNDGCVHSSTSRHIGEVALGGLPSGVPGPAGYDFLVKMTAYSDFVSAEAGYGSADPDVSASGTIQYWNGSGYTALTLSATAQAIDVAPVTAGDVTITAQLSTGGCRRESSVDPSNVSIRLEARAMCSSPILGTITYVMGGSSMTLHVDLGTATARSSYSAAPNAL